MMTDVLKDQVAVAKSQMSPISTPQDNRALDSASHTSVSTSHHSFREDQQTAYIAVLEQYIYSLKVQLQAVFQMNQMKEVGAIRQAELQQQVILLKAQLRHAVKPSETDAAEVYQMRERILYLQQENDGLYYLVRQRDETQKEAVYKALEYVESIQKLYSQLYDQKYCIATHEKQIEALYAQLSAKECETEKYKRVYLEAQYLQLNIDYKSLYVENTTNKQKVQQAMQQMNRMKRKLTQLQTSNLHFSDLSDDSSLKRHYLDAYRSLAHERQMKELLRGENERLKGYLAQIAELKAGLQQLALDTAYCDFKYKTKETCYKLGVQACQQAVCAAGF